MPKFTWASAPKTDNAEMNAFLDAVRQHIETLPKHYEGAGTPEGSVAAEIGSTYSNLSGGAGTTFYVKASGSGDTGWTALS